MISDSFVIQFLTSDWLIGLAKPAAIVVIIGMMIYVQVKPRIEASDNVEL